MPPDGRPVRREHRGGHHRRRRGAARREPILLREERVNAILGVPVASSRQSEILRALDFQVQAVEGG